MSASFKEELRREIKSKFSQWNALNKADADTKLLLILKECLTDFSSNWKLQYGELPILGLYLPLKNEPDILEVLDWNVGRPSFPYSKNQDLRVMEYCCFEGNKKDIKTKGYFFETTNPRFCVPDVVLVPGLAFDIKGYRLGQGKGYFDLYFAQHECLSIGICYSWQLMKQIGAQKHDKRMMMIVTDQEILKLNKTDFL
jgi:5-formyltetrahydrofolate cyclo-ligase